MNNTFLLVELDSDKKKYKIMAKSICQKELIKKMLDGPSNPSKNVSIQVMQHSSFKHYRKNGWSEEK